MHPKEITPFKKKVLLYLMKHKKYEKKMLMNLTNQEIARLYEKIRDQSKN